MQALLISRSFDTDWLQALKECCAWACSRVEHDCFAQVRPILVCKCFPKRVLDHVLVVVHEEHDSLSGCMPLLDMLDEVLAEENQRAC
jgi:hypothetical protein